MWKDATDKEEDVFTIGSEELQPCGDRDFDGDTCRCRFILTFLKTPKFSSYPFANLSVATACAHSHGCLESQREFLPKVTMPRLGKGIRRMRLTISALVRPSA